jgi:predicted amidohydrolase
VLNVAMCQMLVEPGLPERNLGRARRMICDAAAAGCEFAVLPECLDLGWTFPGAPELAEPIPGRFSAALCEAAAGAGIHVVAGLTERAGDRLHNAAVLISPEGSILLLHRKINLLPGVEDGVYSRGDRLGVARAAGATVGVNICADNFPDSLELGRSLARMGAEILLSPCAWAVDADHDNRLDPYGDLWSDAYGTLARECGMAVVGVSNVGRIEGGPWKGRKCIGCSLAVGAGGETIEQGPYGDGAEALLTVALP